MAQSELDTLTGINPTSVLVTLGQGTLALVGIGLIAAGIMTSMPVLAVAGAVTVVAVAALSPQKAAASEPSAPVSQALTPAAFAGATAVLLTLNMGNGTLSKPLPPQAAPYFADAVSAQVGAIADCVAKKPDDPGAAHACVVAAADDAAATATAEAARANALPATSPKTSASATGGPTTPSPSRGIVGALDAASNH